jgi:hypothetical protein
LIGIVEKLPNYDWLTFENTDDEYECFKEPLLKVAIEGLLISHYIPRGPILVLWTTTAFGLKTN